MKDHMGPQFVRVFHASDSGVPPHQMPYWWSSRPQENTNLHPDVIHAGSETAANLFNRDYVHVYDIPVESQYPVTFGDEPSMTFSDRHELFDRQTGEPVSSGGFAKVFQTQMRGVQQGLFESIPGDPKLAVKTKMAVPYRNKGEDPGHVSWMIPKDGVAEGNIKYKGLLRGS